MTEQFVLKNKLYIKGNIQVRTVLTYYVRTFLLGPIVGLIWGWDQGGWKDLCETTPTIKFDPNPMPLTPSSVAHKFNGFIFKKLFNPRSTVQSIRMCVNP